MTFRHYARNEYVSELELHSQCTHEAEMIRKLSAPKNVTAAFFNFGIILILTGCEKVALDSQMDSLCKKDGGTRVYETVNLPPEMFDKLGDPFPGWPNRSREDGLGPDYKFVVETVFLKNGDPQKGEGRLTRTSQRVYRRKDGKLLGESITYGRAGGDFFAFAHPSSNSCPIYSNASDTVIRSVFLMKAE